MLAKTLCNQLDKDFIFKGMTDNWINYMTDITHYLAPNFIERSMGLVCDFARNIYKVFTAVFPSEDVMQTIIDSNISDGLLFLHHPSIWNLAKTRKGFYQMKPDQLEQFRQRRISIYALHSPLDNFSEYSTSKTLADALGIEIEKPCVPYNGGLAAVIGKTKVETIEELNCHFANVVEHTTKLYLYGDNTITGGKVMVASGGGNDIDTLSVMAENYINTLLTGISVNNDRNADAHQYAKEKRINILGGTHYSTEKFACQRMCDYFKRFNLDSEFIDGEAGLEDL